MMAWSVIKNNMQERRGSATVLDEIVNRGNDTIIIDVLVEDDSMKRIIFAKEANDIQALAVVLRWQPEWSLGMLPGHWLWCLQAKACCIGIGKFNFAAFFALLQKCQMLLALLVFFWVGRLGWTLNNTLEAISGFTESAANCLGADGQFFF